MVRPRIVAWLGYGGLIPFLALAVLTHADHQRADLWHGYLAAYGAVILSFIGAVHWGFAMTLGDIAPHRRNAMYAWSVVPCLIAFSSLAAHFLLGDILLTIGFLVQFRQDRRLSAVSPLPAWYLPLRLQLTAVAVICVVVGARFPAW